MDTQWSDDFHHCLHALLTGERHGYYSDFGQVWQLAKAYEDGYVYDGCWSQYRKRRHGADSRALPGSKFIVCAQNHDQIGNRPLGERLSTLLPFSAVKLAATALLVAPNIPLLFMGEEYGEMAPFLYFVSHGDPQLIEGVRKGRAEEFREFFSHGTAPDPQSEETFERSKIDQQRANTPANQHILNCHKFLLELRRSRPALNTLDKRHTRAIADDLKKTMLLVRGHETNPVAALFNFSPEPQHGIFEIDKGSWHEVFDSEDSKLGGAGRQISGTLVSEGEIQLDLLPFSAIILEKF